MIFAANDNAPIARQPKANATKFAVGQTYWTRSACDHNCIFTFVVVARTAKQVTLSYQGRTFKRGVYTWGTDQTEQCRPLGSYSMAPVLSADKNG